MNHAENTEVAAHPPLRASPEAAESAAVIDGAAGILDDSLLGPALEGEALEEQIRLQVEYFLSRDYLSTDPYLVGQMNSDMYFPITTVATLTTYKVDLEVLVKALRKSTQLTVNDNGTMVKPNFKIQRNTLILRDIPSSTNVEEVQGIFQGEGCPVVTGIRPDIGECWFVTFNSEEDALKALDFVRGRSFREAPIKARIKSENLLRSFTYHPPAPAAGDLIPRNPPFNYYYPQYTQDHHQDHRRQRSGGHRQPSSGAAGSRKDYRSKYSNGTAGHAPATSAGSSPVVSGAAGSGASAVASPPVPNTNARGGPQAPTSDSDNRKQRRPGNRGTGGGRKQEGGPLASTSTTPSANAKASHGQQPLQLGLAHFPPLSSQSQAKPKQTGYTKDFTKFTKKQLIDIVTSAQVPNQQPSSFPTDCLATLAEPNTQIVISPESKLDHLTPVQEDSVSASPRQDEAAPSTSTLPTPATTPAQPTITMASLVATHKSIPAPAPAPAPKKPQAQAKPKPAPQPKKEGSPAQGKGQQQPNAKKASPPAKKAAAQKKPEQEGAVQQPSAAPSPPAASSPATPPTNAAASAPAPAAPSPAAAPASTAPASSPASSGPSTPTYAQLAAKAASKVPAQPVEAKKEAEKKEDKKEEKESASA